MPKTSVFEPLFEDGLKSVNFFNGRRLSAEDLRTERDAATEEQRRLGQAIGDGVVRGLSVREAETSTPDAPAVTVTAGLAINRVGDSIRLIADTDVSLVTGRTAATGTSAVEPFTYCRPPDTGTYRAGGGVYLLTIGSVNGRTGFAPVSGLGNEMASCNRKYVVEGVEFGLPGVSGVDLSDDHLVRNRVAYTCFGEKQYAQLAVDPFVEDTDRGLLASMRSDRTIGDCEVPLAVIYWTTAGVQFIDRWAVRRRPSGKAIGGVREAVSARRVADAEARFFQFQDHLSDLVASRGEIPGMLAQDYFRFLPPAGILPLADSGALSRFDYGQFFSRRTPRRASHMEGSRIEALIRESYSCPPIDLEREELVWIYLVRENRQALQSTQTPRPKLAVVFASGHLGFYGDARFDLARFDFGNWVSDRV